MMSVIHDHPLVSTHNRAKSPFRRLLRYTGASLLVAFVAVSLLAAYFLVPYFSEIDMANAPAFYPFRSETARQRYLSYYDARSRDYPEGSESKFIRSSYGTVLVRMSGPHGALPLLLLPGGGANSLMWSRSVPSFASEFRVYAIDRPGDFGRSIRTRTARTGDDISRELEEVIGLLGLGKELSLVGYSYGGWEAAEYASRHSDLLRRLVLVAPAATVFELPAEFALHGLSMLLPGRYFVDQTLRWSLPTLASRTDEPSFRLFETIANDAYVGLRSFELRMAAAPRVLTDQELARISCPTLFLIGERETLYDAKAAVSRVQRNLPTIATSILAGVGHDLLLVEADRVNARLLSFLQ